MSCLKGNLQEHVRDGGVETFHIKLDEGQLLLLLQVVEPVSRLSGPPPLPQLGLPPKLRVDPLQHLLRHLSQLGLGGVEEATLWVALESRLMVLEGHKVISLGRPVNSVAELQLGHSM